MTTSTSAWLCLTKKNAVRPKIVEARFFDAAAKSFETRTYHDAYELSGEAATSGSLVLKDKSLEVGLFRWEEIPWDQLAFPTVRWALEAHRRIPAGPPFAPATNPPEAPEGL